MSEAIFERIEAMQTPSDIFAIMTDKNCQFTVTGNELGMNFANDQFGDCNADTETSMLYYACKAIEAMGITDNHAIYAIATGAMFNGYNEPVYPFLTQCEYGTFVAWYEYAKKVW